MYQNENVPKLNVLLHIKIDMWLYCAFKITLYTILQFYEKAKKIKKELRMLFISIQKLCKLKAQIFVKCIKVIFKYFLHSYEFIIFKKHFFLGKI